MNSIGFNPAKFQIRYIALSEEHAHTTNHIMNVGHNLKGAETRAEVITLNNGPEFAGKVLDEWACRKGVRLNFIRQGKPIENAFAESFNGRLRDVCLNTNWFLNLKHEREIIEG